jgi:hypothetical protein
MDTTNIYNFIEKVPNNDFQLIWHDEEFCCCVWLPPIGLSDAQDILDRYSAITTHYFIMNNENNTESLARVFTVEPNTIPPAFGFFTALQRKVFFANSYRIGIGYSV